jgi:anti-anti-sigma factor
MSVVRLRAAVETRRYELAVVAVGDNDVSLRATGELDVAASDELAELTLRQLHEGHRFIRIDVAGVSFLDCSCAGALVRVHDACLAAGGMLLIESMRATALPALTITGLDRTLFVTRSVPGLPWRHALAALDALAAVRRRADLA